MFELPNNLRLQQIGMINLFRELKSDMFLSPVLLHGGYTKIMCDSTDTIFQVMGIVVRSLTEGKSEVSDWLKITQPVDTLFLINHEYGKLIAKKCCKGKNKHLFTYDIACVGGEKNEIIQTIIRENKPEAAVIFATKNELKLLAPVLEILRSWDIPVMIFALASLCDTALFDSADTCITVSRISNTPVKFVVKQEKDCRTLIEKTSGWDCTRSSESDIQEANRETDPHNAIPEIKRLSQIPNAEDLI